MASASKLGLLWALYFVQGLPFGFQATAVPVLLRERGASLVVVGLSGVLALPWLLKPLWAPLVDRWHWPWLGRRKSWLLPMQAALAVSALAAALLSERDLSTLLSLVLVMNLFAATLDIAVDGLAVDLLKATELGHGNTAQVVGYKLGMLTGGGLLLWLSGRVGLDVLFAAMAMLIAAVAAGTWWFDERAATATVAILEPPTRIRDVVRALVAALGERGGMWLLLVVATYKLGESMADAMFKPFLIDAAFTKEQVGLWVGTWGMSFSMLGSLLGGLLATRLSILSALAIAATARVIPTVGQWWLAGLPILTSTPVITVTCAEHLCGGALTTTMFALMMSKVDRRIGATHFTALAAIEVLGKTPAAWASGVVAESLGYRGVFAIASLASAAFLLLLWPLRRSESAPK